MQMVLKLRGDFHCVVPPSRKGCQVGVNHRASPSVVLHDLGDHRADDVRKVLLASTLTTAVRGEEFGDLDADSLTEALIDEVGSLSIVLDTRPADAIRAEVLEEGIHEMLLPSLLP